MSGLQNAITLLGVSLLVMLLPFIPMLRNIMQARGKPLSPLASPDPHARATAFRQIIINQYDTLLKLARENGAIRGANDKGRPYIVLGFNDRLAHLIPPGTKRLRTLLLASGHLDIPGELVCDRELFAEGRISIAANSVVKGVLSNRDIALGSRARIQRWARAEKRFDIADGARVKGSASAGIELTAARHVRFERLDAPRIIFGRLPVSNPHQVETSGRFDAHSRLDGGLVTHKDLAIPARQVVRGDVVVSGRLVIGEGCIVIGNLRADQAIHIGAGTSVKGAIYCDGNIVVSHGCKLGGPVVARNDCTLHANCEAGTAASPTTVQATNLRIADACVVHGTVWGLRRGEVMAAGEKKP